VSEYDIITVLVVVLTLAVSAILGGFILSKFQSTGVFNSSPQAQQIINQNANVFPSLFDSIIGFSIIGLSLVVILSAFYIQSQPAFFVGGVIFLIILVVLSSFLGNAYYKFASSTVLNSYANNFPITYWLFENLPLISLVIGIILAVVMYGKTSSVNPYG